MDEGFSVSVDELGRYVKFTSPFLWIDHVTQVIPGKSAIGYKVFSRDESFFSGHYPDEPLVPGSLQFEAIVQMLNVALNTLPNLARASTKLYSFEVKCKREVLPGDRFDIETTVISWRGGYCKGRGHGYVNGQEACEADIILTIPAIMEKFRPR